MTDLIVRFEDFGGIPDQGTDATAAWNRLAAHLDTVDSATAVAVVFRPGRYDFHPEMAAEREYHISNHTQTGKKKCAILLENRRRITLDGNGAELIGHGTLIPVTVVNSTGCTLKNFSVDYQYPAMHQVKVVAVDSRRKAVTVELGGNDPYRIVNGNELYFTDEELGQYRIGSVIHFEATGRMVYGQPDYPFYPEKITVIAPNLLEFSGWRDDLCPGIFLVLRVAPRPTPAIFLDHADQIRVENVTVHFAFGMGLLAQLTENITLDQFHVCRRGDHDPRLFTTHADATHFSGCKGLISSQNGFYEGMNDDAINIHGTYLNVLARLDGRTVRAAYMHRDSWGFPWGQPGDTVQLIQSRTMDYLEGVFCIAAIRPVDAATETGAKTFDITFDRELPELSVETESCGLENLSWTPEVVFRNNMIRNNRARGTLFSTPRRVICENNVFDHVHGSAILLCGDCNGWYETGACREVIIRNNRFVNNLTANYQFTEAVISISPVIPDLAGQRHCFHACISICDNVFEVFDAPLLYVKSAEHVRFTGNVIRYNNEYLPFHQNRHTFLLDYASDVVIANNDFGNYQELQIDIVSTPSP